MSAVVIVEPWFWADGLVAIDVAGAVAPHPRQKHLGTNCKAPSYSNLHRMMMGTLLQQPRDWFLQKATLEQDVLLETSAHCIQCPVGSLFQDLRR
jgi:hypothetical protein